MKVFISADMEGITGIPSAPMTHACDRDYGRARELMTGDVNAAIEGALAAGASEICVRDAHDSATNLLVEQVASPAAVIQGWHGVPRMMEGIDGTFDAAVLIGYHARAMTPTGTVSHTMTPQIRGLWYNGVEMGEYGVSAAHAGHYDVPVVFLSGDDAACCQAQELLGRGLGTAVVKTAYGRDAAKLVAVEDARGRIRQGVAQSLERVASVSPFRPDAPIEVKLELQTAGQADAACLVPTVLRGDGATVQASAPDGAAAASLVCVLLAVAR